MRRRLREYIEEAAECRVETLQRRLNAYEECTGCGCLVNKHRSFKVGYRSTLFGRSEAKLCRNCAQDPRVIVGETTSGLSDPFEGYPDPVVEALKAADDMRRKPS